MVNIREIRREDLDCVHDILHETKKFTEEEIRIAMEMVDVYLDNPQQKDYQIWTAVLEDNTVVGFVNFGPVPLTENTYDVYWIAVSPSFQGQGIGKALISFAETKIKEVEGHMICIETSSTIPYDHTQKFYLSRGYVLESRIKDFYRAGDDRLIFVKRLNAFT